MSVSAGLSGLAAASRRLDAAAWGVARAGIPRSGVPADRAALAGPPAPPPRPAAPPATAAPVVPVAAAAAAPPVDLAREMVETIAASRAVLANLQTIRRADEAIGALLDDPDEEARPPR